MAKYGDPIDPVFLPDEELYLRVNPSYYVQDLGVALLHHVGFPKFSVNRGKYSQPVDVTLPDNPGWAVAMFHVRDIPDRLESPKQGDKPPQAFTFSLEHLPENGVYAHSHVCSHAEGGTLASPSKTVKTRFREILRERTTYVLPATA